MERTIIAVGIPEYGMAIINIREKKIFFRFHNLKTGWFCRTHQPFESSVLCVYCLRISKMLAKQFSTSFSKVFTLVLIVSSQMFDTVQGGGHGGGGSQYCLSSDGFHSPECGPAGIQSPPEVTEENTIKGTGYFSWNATNMNLEMYVERISHNILIIPKTFFHLFVYSYSALGSIAFRIYDAFYNCVAIPTSYLQNVLLKHLSKLILSLLYGLLVILFSWLLVYYDSTIPGVFPPTPISPKKLRMQSGHTFHLGYLLGLINGIIVFGLTFWEQIMH